jgi:hypothetical protein
MNSIKSLCFAGVLVATSTTAYSMNLTNVPPRLPPVVNHSHNDVVGDELKFGPISGAKSKPQVQVLTSCRVKYSKELEISTVWTTRFGRTGWWCTYKTKRT